MVEIIRISVRCVPVDMDGWTQSSVSLFPPQRDVYGNLNTATVAIPLKDHHSTLEQIYSQSKVLHQLNQVLGGYSCLEDQGDLHAHLVSINQWTEDDPCSEVDLSMLDTSSQATFEEEMEEEEETVVDSDKGLEKFAATLSVNAVREALKKVKEQNKEVEEVREKSRESRKAAAKVVASTLTDIVLSEVKKSQVPSPPTHLIPSNTETRETTDGYAANLSQQILAEVKQDLLHSPTIPIAISISSGPVHTRGSASNTPQVWHVLLALELMWHSC